MHHIVNEHAWIIGHGDRDFNKCLHEPIDDTNKPWLDSVKNASTLRDLANIVFDKRFLSQIDKYLNFRY